MQRNALTEKKREWNVKDSVLLFHAAVSGPITQGTTNLITVLLLPVAIAMIAYALATFYARSIYLHRKQVRRVPAALHAPPFLMEASTASVLPQLSD